MANKYTNQLTLETGCGKHAPLKSLSVCDPQNEMVRTGLPQSLGQLYSGGRPAPLLVLLLPQKCATIPQRQLDCQLLFISDGKFLFVGVICLEKKTSWLLLWA